jgi:hypothetical protein
MHAQTHYHSQCHGQESRTLANQRCLKTEIKIGAFVKTQLLHSSHSKPQLNHFNWLGTGYIGLISSAT